MYSKNIPVVPEYAIPAARGEYLAFCEGGRLLDGS